ncbi:MAG: hypothetical protein JWR83_1260 [Aeromicrobium sp.]|nr:hypothetical protein [Aeromicrobium sp.]
MPDGRSLIDPDDRRTWPSRVKRFADQTVDRVRGSTEYVSDLPIREDDQPFRELLEPDLLLAYHATRLLPHEIDTIQREGLRQLSPDLIAGRVAAAYAAGAITDEQRDALATASVFHDRDASADVRRDTVCAFLSRRILAEDVAGVWPLITTWGGEGIYMSSAGARLRPVLKTIGTPAVVMLGLDLSAPGRHLVFPGVLHCFIGKSLGLRNRGADVHFRGSVPSEQIIDIWTPGHPMFDRYPELLEAR